ncbi:hypothetical protein CR513_37404, partial [Mucuna pruriens]
MEQKNETSVIISIDQKAIAPHQPNEKTLSARKGSKNIFKMALLMMRGRRSRKSKVFVMDDKSKSIWRKIVGSIRPLHLQSDHSPSPHHNNNDNNIIPIIPQSKPMITAPPSENSTDHSDEGFESASEFTCSPPSSRYASAVGLSEMMLEEENKNVKEEEAVKENSDDKDKNNDDENDEKKNVKEEDVVKDKNDDKNKDNDNDGDWDEMIDAKAEEFIAQFYRQIRLQSLNVMDFDYQEISMRDARL